LRSGPFDLDLVFSRCPGTDHPGHARVPPRRHHSKQGGNRSREGS
jgi:hypothetical protein